MNLEFSRQKLAENIMALIQQKKLRIGEVEQQIGISTGYLTKMLKKETDSAPSTDIIWRLSKVLGVSTDMLIEGDFSKATDNLQYMRKFLYRLQSLTDTNELEWDRISISDVNEALRSESPSLPIIVTMDKANVIHKAISKAVPKSKPAGALCESLTWYAGGLFYRSVFKLFTGA